MNVAELVARHARDQKHPSVAIVVRASAQAFATSLTGGPPVRSWDEHSPQESGTLTFVEVVEPGKEEEQIAELSAVLGDTDVALLLFEPPPEMLPVGVVTATLSRHRLIVLDGCGTAQRAGRTAVAVSRDAERHQRAYLTGTPIPDDERSRLRQRNEWALEGLQLRSGVLLLEGRLEGQAAELLQAREERRRLDQELTDAKELSTRLAVLESELSSTQDALTASEQSLAVSQRSLAVSERSLAVARRQLVVRPSRVRKAVRLLAENPKQGSVRIARAIARRWRR